LVVAGRVDHAFTCSDCQQDPPAYDQARSLFHYEGGVRTAIHALKYHRDFSVIPDLSRILFAGLNAYVSDPYEVRLVPVPLHRKRLATRGFNQGLELISGMRRLDKRLQIWQGLKRIKNTETQTRLSKAARKSNVRGAFRVSKKEVPERVVLVDDVMTTGATLDACARVLKRSGVLEVITLTVARG
jgi:ComF family protein